MAKADPASLLAPRNEVLFFQFGEVRPNWLNTRPFSGVGLRPTKIQMGKGKANGQHSFLSAQGERLLESPFALNYCDYTKANAVAVR